LGLFYLKLDNGSWLLLIYLLKLFNIPNLRFLPPNMAALFGPAIGARTSRQEDFGHTTPRAIAQFLKMNKDGVTGFWPVIFIILTTFWPTPQLSQFSYDRVTSGTQIAKTGTNYYVFTLTSDGDLLCTNPDTPGSTQNPKPFDYPSWPQFSIYL
jgi:hypothetical protein